MGEDASEKMVSEAGETEFAGGIVKQIGLALEVPQRNVGVAATPGQMHERLWHEGGAQPMPLGELLDHEFEEHVAIGGHERVVIGRVQLELTVCVLVIALVRPPAEPEHRVANRLDQLVVT
jgi:hypothetical protein